MKRRAGIWAIALALMGGTTIVEAAQNLRLQVNQKGDFLLIGNTLGHECAAGTPAPIVGNVGMCGANTNDSAPDIFWRSESPMASQAEANNTITAAQARSTAVLNIPAGATVTHAFLYWGATVPGGDITATLDRPGGFSQNITSMQMYYSSSTSSYQSVANITEVVQAQGSGAYRMSGVDSVNIVDLYNNNSFAGWWMVVFYQLDSDPLRNLALFDGLDNVSSAAPQNLTLDGFFVPAGFTAGKLGIVAFEGENTFNGDSFSFGAAPALTDGNNLANNFFNGTHSYLGMPVTTPGDLPQLAGTPQSMSGMDIDIVDVTAKLNTGMTSAPISATSTGDNYYLAGFVTSIPTFRPDFSTSQKSAVDINGGSLLPGDIVEYTIVATNTGTDTSINTVLTDPLPMGVTYVSGTISISTGANAGMKTDATMDDQCEYVSATRTITCRLGTGANGMMGGQMLDNDSTTVVFRVTVDPTASGTILNLAIIEAAGLSGSPLASTPTDGNGAGNGQPTPIVIEQCALDADCSGGQVCNTVANPNVCVAPGCGNNVLEATEGCDDGNTSSGDGCDSTCLRELGQTCSLAMQCASGFCDSADNVCACDENADCSGGQLCNTAANPNICVPPGCGNNVLEAGEGCDDGNTTSGDGCNSTCLLEPGQVCVAATSCANGFCVDGVCCQVATCTAQDQCHDVGTCQPGTGICDNPAKVDGSSCNDGNANTQMDVCQSGTCVGTTPSMCAGVTCTAMDECHNAGTCDPATGLCDNPAKPDDAPCKNASTGNAGTCQVGICVSNKDAPEPCQVDSECPTLFECIEGKCQPVTKGPLDSIPGCGCSHVGDNGTSSQTSPFALLALGVFFARKRCAKNRRVELYIGNAEGGEETKP